MSTDRFAWLAAFKPNQLHLTRNDFASNYCTAKEWIEEFSPEWFADETTEQIQAMKDANTIWTLQIYPDTPIGFYRWNRDTLEGVIDAAMEHFSAPNTR